MGQDNIRITAGVLTPWPLGHDYLVDSEVEEAEGEYQYKSLQVC